MGKRIIFLDEADKLTDDAQDALRRTMEKSKAIFILSGNYGYKINEAIQSRCADYIFNPIDSSTILQVLLGICNNEEIELDLEDEEIKAGFIQLVDQSKGDLRKAINILDKLTSGDKVINKENITSFKDTLIAKDIIDFALSGNFKKAKDQVEDAFISSSCDPNKLILDFYKAIGDVKELKHQVKLYLKLREIASDCKYGNEPIIQFVGFVAYVYLLPHLSNECPVLRGELEK